MNRLSLPYLYGLMLLLLGFVFLASFGEMLWGAASGRELHWTEKLFFNVCHQLPDRTYAVNGLMMAVNTRCFGIFAGMLAGWLSVPFLGKHTAGRRWPVIFLALTVSLQIVDYLGNLVELWQNTNHSRASLGLLFGAALSVSVSDLFFKQQQSTS